MGVTILGIETSCDDTSAAIIQDGYLLSNIIASQEIHKKYGGVVPELASRSHQQNIVPVVDAAIKEAQINKKDIDAIAFTRGPGLLGSLLVGTSFAKGFALANNSKLIEVNHLQGHVLANFIQTQDSPIQVPQFPFLCLLVSGGHTQIMIVKDYLQMEIIGRTIDDAAGEAVDKCAKVLGLPYPGGPVIDKLSQDGDENKYQFNKPNIKDLDYSFSGLKTSFLYFLRDELKNDELFIKNNLNDIAASIQKTIVDILLKKLEKAVKSTGIKEIVIGGGVAANSKLRDELINIAKKNNWNAYLPERRYTTDNAAMIGLTGYYKCLNNQFTDQNVTPLARYNIDCIR